MRVPKATPTSDNEYELLARLDGVKTRGAGGSLPAIVHMLQV